MEGQEKVTLEVESRSKQGCPTEKGLEEPLDLKDEHLQEADIQERSKVLGEGQGCVCMCMHLQQTECLCLPQNPYVET